MVTPIPADAISATLGQLTIHVGADEVLVEGPPAPGEPREIEPVPAAFHAMARFDDSGRYRPLPGARTLPGGWYSRFASLESLDAALDAVYPLLQHHAAQYADGGLRVVTLEVVFARQAGRYQVAAELTEAGRALAVRMLCGICVKTPIWREGTSREGAVPGPDILPCPEPCSVFLALCREAALWEKERPKPVAPDANVGFAAFEQPGNEIRERMLAVMEYSP